MIFKLQKNIFWIVVFLPIFAIMFIGFKRRKKHLSRFIEPDLWFKMILIYLIQDVFGNDF